MTMTEALKKEVGMFQRAWGNGTRGLLLVYPFFLAVMIILALALVFNVCSQKSEFHPMTYHNPAKIVSVKAYIVTATIERCNASSEQIAVTGSFTVRGINGQLFPQLQDQVSVWDPGCATITPGIPLMGIPPGTYRLEGNTVARSDHNETQVEAWFSEPFTVPGDQ